MSQNQFYPQRSPQGDQKQKQPAGSVNLAMGRIPPQSIEMEMAVLGAILLEKSKLQEVVSIIPSGDCFYASNHQEIYETILSEESRGASIDMLTIAEALRKAGKLESSGGAYYLTELTMNVVTSAHVESHARIVMEKFFARELIKASGDLLTQAYDQSNDVFSVLDYAEQRIMEISASNITTNYKNSPELAKEVIEEYYAAASKTTEFIGIDTGFQYLNAYTKGWQNKKFVVIGARPSMGKTALVINLLINAEKTGIGVGLFNLEMGSSEISKRIISAMSGIELDYLIDGTIPENQMEAFHRYTDRYSRMNIKIDDSSSLTMLQLRSKARAMKKSGIGLIAVDYLQLMDSASQKGGNREQEISRLSRGLKQLSKDLDIPVIALSQLNREVENKDGKIRIPVLSDLRESGAIEQDADIVMFLYGPKPDEIDENGDYPDPTRLLRFLKIAKNRQGSIETIRLHFNMRTQKMSDYDEGLSHKYQPEQNPYSDGLRSASKEQAPF